MKWFVDDEPPSNEIELADHCIDYLKKIGERPERDSAIRTLFILISKRKVSKVGLKRILGLNEAILNHRIATKADADILEAIAEEGLTDQVLFAIMLKNRFVTRKVIDYIDENCDDSDRGYLNRKIIEKRRRKDENNPNITSIDIRGRI